MQQRQRKNIGGLMADTFFRRWNNPKVVTRYPGPQSIKNTQYLQGSIALDFGSGTGRNRPLLDGFDHVLAFDLPNSSKACEESYDLMVTAWESVSKSVRIDLVLAVFVFQHMSKHNLDTVLRDMAVITKHLLVVTRDYMDDGNGAVEDYILRYFDLVEGTKDFYDINDEEHFEAVYVPKKEVAETHPEVAVIPEKPEKVDPLVTSVVQSVTPKKVYP